MKTTTLSMIAAGLALLPTAAFAHNHAGHNEPATRAELQKMLASRFDQMDRNKDGVINADERRAEQEARHAEMFKRADTDGDSKLSLNEMKAMREARLDGDAETAMRGDGLRAKMHKRMSERRLAKLNASEPRDQFMTRRLAMFDRVDANKDGAISTAERDAARAKMHRKMRRHGGHGMTPPPPAL